jgi:hypothetical protein
LDVKTKIPSFNKSLFAKTKILEELFQKNKPKTIGHFLNKKLENC